MTFGTKLKNQRQEKHISQKELANIIGVSLNTINNYENGKTYPHDRSVYKKLADALSIDVAFLYNENDEQTQPEQILTKDKANIILAQTKELLLQGNMTNEELDEFMQAVEQSYWKAKKNKKKLRLKNNFQSQKKN